MRIRRLRNGEVVITLNLSVNRVCSLVLRYSALVAFLPFAHRGPLSSFPTAPPLRTHLRYSSHLRIPPPLRRIAKIRRDKICRSPVGFISSENGILLFGLKTKVSNRAAVFHRTVRTNLAANLPPLLHAVLRPRLVKVQTFSC